MFFKYLKLFILLIIVSGGMVSCDFEDPWPEENGVTVGSYISSNPTDPEFVKMVTNEGNEVSVFGERDARGLPRSVNQINVVSQNGSSSLFFNDADQLSTFVADNGTIFNYVSTTDGNLAVNIVCNDNETELNVLLDVSTISDGTADENTSSYFQENESCQEIGFIPFEESSDIELKSTTAQSYLLHVTNCYATNDIDIPYRVLLYNSTGFKLIKELSATKLAEGKYEIALPTESPAVDENELVDKLNTVLGNYCGVDLLNKIASESACAQITSQIANMGITASVANGVGTACSGIKDALDIYCQLVSANQPDGTTAIDAIANQKMVENFTLTDDSYQLKVYFKTIPEKVFDFTLADNLSSDLYAELNTSSKATIKKLETDPVLPNANDDYTINMLVYCIPLGSTLTISVTGDDGFYDEASLAITDEAQSSGWYNYTVKARPGKTRDDLKVRISNGWSSDVVRKLSLPFGSKGSSLTGPYESFHLFLDSDYGFGVESQDTCPFTGVDANLLEWDGNNFSSIYEYESGENIYHIEFTGKIETTSSKKLISGEYSCQFEFVQDGLHWQSLQYLELTRIPVSSFAEEEALYKIDYTTPTLYNSIKSYLNYTSALTLEGETSGSSDFGSNPEFTLVFKK